MKTLKELRVKNIVKRMLEDKSFDFKAVKINPVVDPSAAETDPSNQNFTPSNKMELVPALRTLVQSVDDDNASKIYVMIKDTIETKKTEDDMSGKEQMKNSNEKIEELRKIVRTLLKEAMPVPPPPPMPARRILPAAPQIDPELEDMIKSGIGRAQVVAFLKKKNPRLTGPDAQAQAEEYMNQVFGPRDAAAKEKFLAGVERGEKQITKLPSKYKPLWPEKAYPTEAKKSSSVVLKKAEKEINKLLYTTNFEGINIKGVNFDLAAEAYYDAYAKTMSELSGADPQVIVDSKEFNNNFKEYLQNKGIEKPPTVIDVRNNVGFQAVTILGEKLETEKQEIEDDIKYMKKERSVEEPSTVPGRQNISKAEYTLKETAEALGISIGMIKKIEAQALGKYVLGIKSEIFELMPDDMVP